LTFKNRTDAEWQAYQPKLLQFTRVPREQDFGCGVRNFRTPPFTQNIIKMQVFLALAAFLLAVNGQSCPRNVPDELKVECDTILNRETGCRLSGCCWDDSPDRNSGVPRCFRRIEEGGEATTTDASASASATTTLATSVAETSTTSLDRLATSTTSRTSTPTVSPTASADADNSSSGPSIGAKVGYVLAGITGFLILVAGGTYAYNKFTEDDDSSAPKLDLLSPDSNAEPKLQRHDNWMKEVPPIPTSPNATQYAPNAATAYYATNAVQYDPNAVQYDPNAVQYDPNAVQYDPNAVQYDPNAVQYDPNAVQYDPNVQYAPNVYSPGGQYYSSGIGQEQHFANHQQNPQFAQPHSNGHNANY
jgi:Trefoil (P-type) domain